MCLEGVGSQPDPGLGVSGGGYAAEDSPGLVWKGVTSPVPGAHVYLWQRRQSGRLWENQPSRPPSAVSNQIEIWKLPEVLLEGGQGVCASPPPTCWPHPLGEREAAAESPERAD